MPSIIVTLGTLAIYRGILVDHHSDAKTVTTDSLPDWLIDLPTLDAVQHRRPRHPRDGRAGGRRRHRASSSLLSYLNVGRRFYAIGSNPDAAALVGLPTQRIVFSGLRALGRALGPGRLHVPRRASATSPSTAGHGLELQSSPPSVVGGVNIFGGSGTVFGAHARRAADRHCSSRACCACRSASSGATRCSALLILLAVASDAVILGSGCGRSGRAPTLKLIGRAGRRATARTGGAPDA